MAEWVAQPETRPIRRPRQFDMLSIEMVTVSPIREPRAGCERDVHLDRAIPQPTVGPIGSTGRWP
jgi:hypothetical protein